MASLTGKKQFPNSIFLAFATLILSGASLLGFLRWRGINYPSYDLDLGNNQKVTLSLKRRGEKLRGTLTVAPLRVSNAPFDGFHFQLTHHFMGSFKRLTQPIPAGDYALEGLFMAPRSYRVAGKLPPPLREFSISGELPEAKEAGSYFLLVDGAIVNGVLPALDSTSPPKKPSDVSNGTTAPPAYPHCRVTGTLKKSPPANAQASSFSIGLHYGHLPVTSSGLWVGSFVMTDSKQIQQLVFNVEPGVNKALKIGQQFSLHKGSGHSLTYSEYGEENKDWDSVAGTLEVQSIHKGEVTFVINNAILQGRSGTQARGTLTLNARGKMQATSLARQGML